MKQHDTEIKLSYLPLATIFSLLFLLCFALQFFDTSALMQLSLSKINNGEIWRLLTAHFIHINWQHFLMNMLGAGLCLAVFRDDVPPLHWVYSAVLLSLFSSIGLYFIYDDGQTYVGFSDVLHGWIAIGVFSMLPKETKLAAAMLTFCLFKVFYENFFDSPSSDMLEGSRVATESHLLGCIGGGVFSLSFNTELRHFLLALLTKQKKTG